MSDADRPEGPAAEDGAGAPVDPRPRPQYGEYAPEGWTWTPPEQPAPAAPVAPDAPPVPAAPGAERPVRPIDRAATIALLVLGVFGATIAVSTTLTFPESMRMLHAQYDLPDYEAPANAGTITTLGAIAQVALYAATLLGSWARLRVRRSAWWVPVLGAAASFVGLLLIASQFVNADPALLEFFGSVGNTTPPTTAR